MSESTGGQIEQPREDKRTRRGRTEPTTPQAPGTESGPSGSEAGDRLTPAQYDTDGRDELPAQYES